MDVYMMVRRKSTTIFLNCKENHQILEVKKMIEGILKVSPEDQVLYKQTIQLDDSKSLSYYNLNSQTARAHTPASLVLSLKDPVTGKFEPPSVTAYSTPPELPEVMRGPEAMPSPSVTELVGQAKP
ncbi:unnamed protein product [Protopolystoma xenopodis]|uniref:Ubiquitin-like domain-containing protein n=1 Tax=Protopolystoma xenopodis TaxID=117903 RepID=A0A448X9P7_9PLAT|nr:unnamed protein product [Protopolystoma xenopodis]